MCSLLAVPLVYLIWEEFELDFWTYNRFYFCYLYHQNIAAKTQARSANFFPFPQILNEKIEILQKSIFNTL